MRRSVRLTQQMTHWSDTRAPGTSGAADHPEPALPDAPTARAAAQLANTPAWAANTPGRAANTRGGTANTPGRAVNTPGRAADTRAAAAAAVGDAAEPVDRWPQLPDDSTLWQPPKPAFDADLVRRLDDEQRGW